MRRRFATRRVWAAALAAGVLLGLAGTACIGLEEPEGQLFGRLLFGDGSEQVLLKVEGHIVRAYRGEKAEGEPMATLSLKDAFNRNEPFVVKSGDTTYEITGVSEFTEADVRHLIVSASIHGAAEYDQYADLALDPSPSACAVAQFGGPLSAGPSTINWKVPESLKLVRGDKPTDLRLVVGTMDAARRMWVVVESCKGKECTFPDGVRPTVEVEYPNVKPEAPPIKRQYTLDGFC